MCGIVGIISPDVDRYMPVVDEMLECIRHRGPDDSGVYKDDNCILGHRRLSIVDLEKGHQPMYSSLSNKIIVFNGEIYGYKKIKEQIDDYRFNTESDTEVILALYEKFGSDSLLRLPGMYSFAIWDKDSHMLFAARDRFGEKPFYYALGSHGELIFSSEIKAIVASGLVEPALCIDSLIHYFKYLYIHPSRTIYKNIFSLPPGHFLKFHRNSLRFKRYWSFPVENTKIEINEAVEEFRRLFEKAIFNQLIADVPVGCFLSGGLDSSTVIAVASKYKRNIKSFSFGFDDDNSELNYAEQIANMYQTDHHILMANNVNIGEMLVMMTRIYDEPFGDSSNIPTFLISKLAREHSKVILTGDGADELLGGYSWWYKPLLQYEMKSDYQLIRRSIYNIIACFSIGSLLRKGETIVEKYMQKAPVFEIDEICCLLGLKKKMVSPYYVKDDNWAESYTLNDALKMDIDNYMPGDILVKIDRASMANSLELRAPFLDVDFASFCISLPSRYKITDENDKMILRAAYENAWSAEIRKRGKQGFGAPVSRWLKRESVVELKEVFLKNKNSKMYSYIDYNFAQRFFDNLDYKAWLLLVLCLWSEMNSFALN